MAKTVSKNPVAGAISALKKKAPDAVKKAAGKEPKVSGGFLPGGINGGIAQYKTAVFSTIEKGKPDAGSQVVTIKGIVVSPESVAGQRIKGKPANMQIRFVATKGGSEGGRKWEGRSIQDRIDQFLDVLKLLTDSKMEGMNWDDVPEILETLEEEQPYFTFDTWQGQATKKYPNPRTSLKITGLAEDFQEEEADEVDESPADDDPLEEAEEDEEDTEEGEEGEEEDTEETEEEGEDEEGEEDGDEASEGDDEEDSEDEGGDEEEEPSEDWPAVGKLADKKNRAAQTKLTKKADTMGLDTNDYKSWSLLAKAIVEAEDSSDDEGEGGEDEDEATPPSKGDKVKFKPKGSKVAVPASVIKVIPSKETVDLKALKGGKIYKAVPWSSLS